jgi:ureidoacrylate peracid hydrolase
VHKVSIPQSVIERVVARHGREHVHEDLVPSATALVVVDMQNAFMLPEVAHSPCLAAQDIVPNINRLAQAVRDSGGIVVWLKTTFTEASLESWSVLYGMIGEKRTDKRSRALAAGSKGHELWAALEVQPQDLIVEKNRYSAFVQGSSDLSSILKARHVDTLLITGTVTNVCCESTARDAMMLNYKVVMVSDGNAAATDDDHNASLRNIYLTFGDVMSTDFAIGCLRRNSTKGLAAAE